MASGSNETVTLTAALKDEMSAPLDQAIKKVDGFTDAVETGAKKQAKASERSTSQITNDVDKTSRKYGGLIGVFQRVSAAGSKIGDGIGNGLNKAQGKALANAKRLGEKIGDKVKEGVATAGAAIGAVLAGSIALAGKQASAESLMTAQMGLDPKEAARLGEVSGQLYAAGIGEGLDEINVALEASYKAFGRYGTASNDELVAASTQALAVAKILGVDVTRATQVAGTMIRNELAGNATEAFDLITAGSQNAAAGMGGDILDALDEYATFFTSMGFSGQEALGLLSEASHGGIMQLDKMGDAIKEFGIRATDGSKATATAFETIGMRGDIMADRIVKGGPSARKALGEIADGLLKIKDPAVRAQTAIALFGTPLEDMDVTLIPSFLQSLGHGGQGLEDFAGKAQAAADSLNSGTGFEIEKFKREAITSLSEFGASAIVYVKPFFDFMKTNSSWLPPVALAIGGVAAALAVLNAVLAVTAVVGWPVTLVVIALAALAAAAVWAYNNIGWFKDGVDAAFKFIGEAAVNVWAWIQLAFTNVVSFWQTNVAPVIDWLVNYVFAPAFDWISRLVVNAVSIITVIFRELTSFWNTHLHPAITILVGMFTDTLGPGITEAGHFIEDLQKGFGIFMAFLQAKFAPQIEAIKFIFDRVAEAIGNVLGKIGEFANNPLGGIQDWMGIKKDANGRAITTPGAGDDNVGGFAGGGVLGGYSPGRDSILARLSPGESVLVPELTQAIGPRNIMAANAAASGGRKAGSGPSLTTGYSARTRGGTSLSIGQVNFNVPVTTAGTVDLEAMKAAAVEALEEALAAHNRRSYA
jgi:phage-related minor tail protein